MEYQFLKQIREQNPLIHNITNNVVINFVANGLLALGASPIMGEEFLEMRDFSRFCNALAINIGSITELSLKAMLQAGFSYNKEQKPIVFDPVGVGVSEFRIKAVKELLEKVHFSAIRGNVAEISFLATGQWGGKGVDVGNSSENAEKIAEMVKNVAKKYNCVVIASGAVDFVSNGEEVLSFNYGSPMFPRITGSGCLFSAVVGAFLAVAKPSDYFLAAQEATIFYAKCGENAAKNLKNHEFGSFMINFLNSLGV